MERNTTPSLPYTMKPSGLPSIFILLKKFRQRGFHKFIRKFFKVVALAVENSLVFREGPLEIVGNVRMVSVQSIRVVDLLIVDVHLNMWKSSVQNVGYVSNEKNGSLLLFFRPFLIFFCFFFVLFFFLLRHCRFLNRNTCEIL